MRQSIFSGTIQNEPILRKTFSGSDVLNLDVLVRDPQGDGFVENLFKVAVFGKQAKGIALQAKIGSEIMCVCRPESRQYTDKNGRSRRSEDHIAMMIRVCLPMLETGGSNAE